MCIYIYIYTGAGINGIKHNVDIDADIYEEISKSINQSYTYM
jgi:hypothetical protein